MSSQVCPIWCLQPCALMGPSYIHDINIYRYTYVYVFHCVGACTCTYSFVYHGFCVCCCLGVLMARFFAAVFVSTYGTKHA